MFENKYIQQRIEKAEKLRNVGINPYSNECTRNTTISKYLNVNSDVFQIEEKRDEHRHYTVAGRIKFFRLMGKASFLKIEDESGVLQIYVSRDNLPEGFYNDIFKKTVEVGDIIEVTNNSNSYIELAGYSIYKGDSILSSDFNKYKSMPPKSVMTLSASNEFNKFKIIVDKSFYSLKLPKSHKLGFAVSYYKEGIKKALFKDKRLAIIYK